MQVVIYVFALKDLFQVLGGGNCATCTSSEQVSYFLNANR